MISCGYTAFPDLSGPGPDAGPEQFHDSDVGLTDYPLQGITFDPVSLTGIMGRSILVYHETTLVVLGGCVFGAYEPTIGVRFQP